MDIWSAIDRVSLPASSRWAPNRCLGTTYAPDVRWTDDEGVSVGREALEAKAIALQSQMQGLVFTKASPVYQTHGFGYLAWNVGPEGGDPVATGFDVAIVRDDFISELYTVITT